MDADRKEALRLADAFERSADWLDKGTLAGTARTHPLVGTADYRQAAALLRRLDEQGMTHVCFDEAPRDE